MSAETKARKAEADRAHLVNLVAHWSVCSTRWNNGDLTPMWIEKKIAKVTYGQFVRATPRINGVTQVHDTSKLE